MFVLSPDLGVQKTLMNNALGSQDGTRDREETEPPPWCFPPPFRAASHPLPHKAPRSPSIPSYFMFLGREAAEAPSGTPRPLAGQVPAPRVLSNKLLSLPGLFPELSPSPCSPPSPCCGIFLAKRHAGQRQLFPSSLLSSPQPFSRTRSPFPGFFGSLLPLLLPPVPSFAPS